jgi:hypothetical protein
MTGPTWTEAWRLECEARHVLTWPLQARRDYLTAVAKARGEAAAQSLKAAISTEWRKQRQKID